MTAGVKAEGASPLSRPIPVTDIPLEGLDVTVEATPEEREALAREFRLPAIHSLSGAFHVSGTRSRVHVSGRVEARVDQICVVTLEPFESTVQEEVEVDFAAAGGSPPHREDPPDELVGGTVDLGAVTTEFLALGLDPHPRKPGAAFAFEAAEDRPPSPFAALEKLKRHE
jgi:uncharacterized metal-binding protein YceD (DUF177 family)